ncbi:GntR family transcriptional regulator [Bradyrhizobium embrapense]
MFSSASVGLVPDPTQAEVAADLIERAIVRCQLLPAQRLGVHALAKRFGIGLTPVREGLSRLVFRGFVTAVGNKGFRVAEMAPADLEDIVRTRLPLEIEALRRSITIGGDDWEAGILAARHRIEKFMVGRRGRLYDEVDEFEPLHRAFHLALIGGCGSERTITLCGLLTDQEHRYRRIKTGLGPEAADIQAEHEELATLALARDATGACKKLNSHILRILDDNWENIAAPRSKQMISRKSEPRRRRKASH